MSAFFVDDACLTKCVSAMLYYAGLCDTPILRSIARVGYLPGAERALASPLGTALRAMNAEALRQRYGEMFLAAELEYTFPGPVEATPEALLKALHCLSYQCSEGNVPEKDPLFAEIVEVARVMEATGVSSLSAAYEAGSWGD